MNLRVSFHDTHHCYSIFVGRLRMRTLCAICLLPLILACGKDTPYEDLPDFLKSPISPSQPGYSVPGSSSTPPAGQYSKNYSTANGGQLRIAYTRTVTLTSNDSVEGITVDGSNVLILAKDSRWGNNRVTLYTIPYGGTFILSSGWYK
ncbi:MAG: hypothetical protein HY537_08180 [Deltaproteobacteria bacterium]|nr:hypothetical protein [Deltaproteobacteria bacterium]